MAFDSKNFEIRKTEVAIAKWVGPKDDNTLANLLKLFRGEKWRGQLQINYPGNGGINEIVFAEQPSKIRREEESQ